MPRIRTIKPDFFTSDTVSTLPLRARLTWIGMWTHCDDHGRCRDNVRLIKAAVWPLDDVSIKDVEIDLNTLADRGLIYRYLADGKNYLAITSWAEHQKVDRPSKSSIPPPPADTDTRESFASDSRALASHSIGKGREGKGREGTRGRTRTTPPTAHTPSPPAGEKPPQKCEQHKDDPNPPPCGACADTRKARTDWERQQAAAESRRQSELAREQAELRRAAIAACRQCDRGGYVNGALCNHDPAAAESTARGAAMARDLMKRKAAAS